MIVFFHYLVDIVYRDDDYAVIQILVESYAEGWVLSSSICDIKVGFEYPGREC